MHLHEKIRKIREASGVSQVELSEKTGMHQSTISAIESGKRNISLRILLRITKVLGFEINFEKKI
jgi:transcriptional regulator with XRE-family HTH domain